jgi:hypothetical protein
MPYFWQMNAAWVPLPAPGAPNRISLMSLLVVSLHRAAGADGVCSVQNSTHLL